MNKTIAAACVGLVLATGAGPALARVKHHGNVNSAPVAHAVNGYQSVDPPWTFACIKDHGTSRCNDLN